MHVCEWQQECKYRSPEIRISMYNENPFFISNLTCFFSLSFSLFFPLFPFYLSLFYSLISIQTTLSLLSIGCPHLYLFASNKHYTGIL